MLTEIGFQQWCKKNQIDILTRGFIEKVRQSPPSRITDSAISVTGRYPSQKMGVSIQFESHTVEYPAIYSYEFNEDVLEFYDQPPSFNIKYKTKQGRVIGHIYTPDFFVIYKNEAAIEEWKTEKELLKLSEKYPERYYFDEKNNYWRCPPGEEYGLKYNLKFHVRTDKEINWTLTKNLMFLEDFLRLSQNEEISDYSKIINHVVDKPGMSTEQLTSLGVNTDDIYTLIAIRKLYVDLDNFDLTDVKRVQIYTSKEHSQAFNFLKNSKNHNGVSSNETVISIGNEILWNGVKWLVGNVGEEVVTLISDEGEPLELKMNAFEVLIENRAIISLKKEEETSSLVTHSKLIEADKKDLVKANNRYEILKRYMETNEIPGDVSLRTIQYWLNDYREAEVNEGYGYLGLLPKTKKRGNRKRKLSSEIIQLMQKLISEDYESVKRRNLKSVYGKMLVLCEERGLEPPSYQTFVTESKKTSQYMKTRKRQGDKSAYKYEEFYWTLESTIPKHGSRPFEIAHIDHTLLDIELCCSNTGIVLGRPWLTIMMDAYSRRVLAFYLSYDSPSSLNLMMILRECVRRNHRLPQTLVMDRGKEFLSIYFDTILAHYNVIKKLRPAAKPKYGNVLERYFGATHTSIIYNLSGNTQATKNVREITKKTDPKLSAVWTLPSLTKLLEKWFFEIYENQQHSSLLTTPKKMFERGEALYGKREIRYIPYDENFIMMTFPTTKKGTAKVQPGKGVYIKGKYYWCEAFRNPAVENTDIQVRYDPFDVSIAYVFCINKWVMAYSDQYSVFNGISEKELSFVTNELKQLKKVQKSKTQITQKELARFMIEVESDERMMINRSKANDIKHSLKLLVNENVSKNTPSIQTGSIERQSFNDMKSKLEFDDLEPFEELK